MASWYVLTVVRGLKVTVRRFARGDVLDVAGCCWCWGSRGVVSAVEAMLDVVGEDDHQKPAIDGQVERLIMSKESLRKIFPSKWR